METTGEKLMMHELGILREFGDYIKEIRSVRLNTLIKKGGLTTPIYEGIREMYDALNINQN